MKTINPIQQRMDRKFHVSSRALTMAATIAANKEEQKIKL